MRHVIPALVLALAAVVFPEARQTFDHTYAAYGELLARHVSESRVNYRALQQDRDTLVAVLTSFASVAANEERAWERDQRLAFWINAYNLFTLDAVASRYPIKGRFFSLHPHNSIRQIDGVWTKLTWKAAGREITLDGIEHGIIRKEFREPLIHFAVNCASVSCPPLRTEPYTASRLMVQLEDSARRYIASREGARVDGRRLMVSSIFKWYGQDFLNLATQLASPARPAIDRAVLYFVGKYGPSEVAKLASDPNARLTYLPYNWSLNEMEGPTVR